jgi:hypothetical protein
MKRIVIFFVLCLFFGNTLSRATNSIIDTTFEEMKAYEDTLGYLSFLIVNDSIEENRFAAVQKFIPTLVKALKTKNSFDYPFDRLKSISIQYPEDRSFRIFTWQLYVDENDYRYYGAIQMNSGELKLIPLIDRSADVINIEHQVLTPDQWYGAVYYNIKEFDTSEGKKYLLFGYDGYTFFTKRKLVDVLSFDNGKATFGAPVFVSEDPDNAFLPKNRLALTYSAEATIKTNYDVHLDLIVFDHLIETTSSIASQGPVKLPDGSYEGYKLKDGRWTYVAKVFNHIYENEEETRQSPIFDDTKTRKQKKDIFGNK